MQQHQQHSSTTTIAAATAAAAAAIDGQQQAPVKPDTPRAVAVSPWRQRCTHSQCIFCTTHFTHCPAPPPHATCRGMWRNGLLFTPNQTYGQHSFADIMTIPIAQAMRDAIETTASEGKLYTPPDRVRPVVYIGFQGMHPATHSVVLHLRLMMSTAFAHCTQC
jgi:hypothetical protein